jgi:hypothetical protein
MLKALKDIESGNCKVLALETIFKALPYARKKSSAAILKALKNIESSNCKVLALFKALAYARRNLLALSAFKKISIKCFNAM